MGHSRLTMLSEFQVDSRGTQPYTHMYSFSPKRLSHPDCRTSNSYRVQWLLKVPHDLLQVQISLCGRATVLKEWRRWEIQAQRVCVWTHSGWETRHQGQTPGHSYTVIPYRETKPGSPHWKQEVRSGSTWHPKLLQTIQPRIINHLTPKMKEETDIILLQTGCEFRCEFRKVCSLKEILKCPESILGYPRVFHLNDQEDKAISSIAFFFFWTSDDGKCTVSSPFCKTFPQSGLLWECSHDGVWSGGWSIGYPRCTEWHDPPRTPGTSHSIYSQQHSRARQTCVNSMSKWICFTLSLLSFRKEHKTSRKGSDLGSSVRWPGPTSRARKYTETLISRWHLDSCETSREKVYPSALMAPRTTACSVLGRLPGASCRPRWWREYSLSAGTKGFGAHRLGLNSSFTIYCHSLYRGHLNSQGISARI